MKANSKSRDKQTKDDRNDRIKRMIRNGYSTREVAAKFNISNKRVWDIANAPIKPRKKLTKRVNTDTK
jgi:transposase